MHVFPAHLACSVTPLPLQLLCCVLRATCTLWQQQRSAFRAARWLRDQPEFWACMEDCITRGKPADAWEPTSDAWLQMAEAYAWHIHMLELFGATAPVHGTGPAGTTSATTAAAAIEAAGSKSRALLEKLVKGGALVKVGGIVALALALAWCA